ncbi:MAG: prenyltransferase [Gammaproteobacteria bacterium]
MTDQSSYVSSNPLEPQAAVLRGDGLGRTAKRLLLATRPMFFPASVLPVLLGSCLGYRLSGAFEPWIFAVALVCVMCVHAGANVLNDVFDELIGADGPNDRRIFPYTGGSRFIQNRVMSVREMGVWGVLLLLLGVVCGLLLLRACGWPVLGFGLVGVALAVAYSMPPLQLSAHGVGELAVAVGFGVLPVSGAAWLQNTDVSATVLLVSIPISLWVAAILLANEVPDAQADAAAGKRTLVVRMGESGSAGLYLGLHALALAVQWLIWRHFDFAPWGLWVPALLLATAVVAAAFMRRGEAGRRRGIEMTLAVHTVGALWLCGWLLWGGA